MAGIGAGDMPYRVAFWRFTATRDDFGGQVKTWAAIPNGARWADIVFGTGRERREAAQEVASAPATFSVRRDSLTRTLTPADRLHYDGADWDISSVVPSRKYDAVLDITAARRTA
jgi:head-tail adaptor